MSEKKLEPKPQYARVPRTIPESPPDWHDPTPKMLEAPEFNALWELMKGWDINVPAVDGESLYTGTTGNHIRAILDALSKVAVVIKKTDAEMVHGAIARSECFFRTRDKMNGHLHLEPPKSSPLAKEVARGLQILSGYVYPREIPGQSSGS